PYDEDVSIPANDGGLILNGAESGVNPTQGRTGPESIINGSITIAAAYVTVDGITVSSTANWCILVNGGTLVENCIVYGLTPEFTYAVWAIGASNTIQDNYIQAGAVYLSNAPQSLVLRNKMVGPPTWSGTEGIDFYYSSNCSAKDNEIDNCTYVFGIRSSENLLIADNFGTGNLHLFQYNVPDSTDTVVNNNFQSSLPATV